MKHLNNRGSNKKETTNKVWPKCL